MFSSQWIKVKDGKNKVPKSNVFKRNLAKVRLIFPNVLTQLQSKKWEFIQSMMLDFSSWVHFSEGEIETVETVKDSALAIDFGIDNLATCVNPVGYPLSEMVV